ncbi:hypothetical protein BsWGS_20394 [Bradybaena similaris]
MDVDDHEWELSKENVQPLRQGRHMSSLVAALHQDQTEDHTIRTQQNNFELELRSYSGDDPFSVWERYIKWTEQHYPKGGHDGQLLKLLERCLREFQADERYTNDPRFIHMWIKFACFTEDPVVVFSYMFDNGIGDSVAALYLEWALSLERNGDSKKADAIYIEGINRRAEPEDLLIQRHQQFQSRVARNITVQIAENQNPGMDMGENEDKRSTLGRLKVSGPSHKVGVVRTGNIKLGSAGSLKDSRSAVPKQVPSRGIPIFQDENAVSGLLPQQTNEWQSLPVRAVDNRENDKNPGVWTDVKVKQRPGSVPHGSTVPFQIHEDPESATQETPRKTAFINTQPLSSRKASQTDVLSNLRRPPAGPNALTEIPMYQKDKIYNGLSEFSFEELRAIKYWRIKKEKEIEAERLRKEEEQRLNQERMQQQMLEMADRLAQLQAQVNSLNFNRPADTAADRQNFAAQQLELTHQIQQTQTLMSDNAQRISELVSASNDRALTQGAQQQPRQLDAENSNTNFSCGSFVTPPSIMDTKDGMSNDFITPTNVLASITCNSFITPTDAAAATLSNSLVTPAAASHAKPGDPHGASTKDSLKTPIFNSVSTYSLNSSSLGRSHMQTFRANTPGSKPALESSVTSGSCSNSSNSDNSTPANMNNSSAISSQPSTVMAASVGACSTTLVESNYPATECNISTSSELCINTSGSSSVGKQRQANTKRPGFGPKESITAPSPTVYTKEALQCVMGMFSTSFMSDEQSITEDMVALHGSAPSASKQLMFDIHEDTTSTFKTERQCLKSASIKKDVHNFYCDPDDGKENIFEKTMPKPEVKPVFGAGSGLNIYCDQSEENVASGAGKAGLFIFHDEPEDKENRLEPAVTFAPTPAFGGSKGLNIYCDQAEDNIAKSSKNAPFIYRDEPENKENGPTPAVLRSEGKPGFATSKGLDIYCDQSEDNVAMARKNGLFIYHDEPEDKENGLSTQKPELRPVFGGSKGVKVLCDQPEDKENRARDDGLRKSAKRGLGFSIYDDVEMIDIDREGPASDFTIECGARNEMTIAGLDSFSVHAKYASTPCVSGFNTSVPQAQDLADATSERSSSVYTSTEVNAPTPNKYLSPISEGSAEGGVDETKSYQQSLAASKVLPNASSQTTKHESILKEIVQEPMEAETEADRDVTMSEDALADLDKSCRHHVDTTTYITQNLHEKTPSGTGFDPRDPFDDALLEQILRSLNPPITEHPNFVACSGQMPDIVQENMMFFADTYIYHEKCIGEGGYAKIYKVTVDCLDGDDSITMDSRVMPSKVIKVQSPPCYWEFYVSTELRRRLSSLKAQTKVISSIMEIEKGYFFEDGSVLQMAHAPNGSLLNLVNKYKNDKSLLAGVEPFACLLTIELLHMFEQIHACGFIHGDVKPDNFLLLEMTKIKPGCKRPQDMRLVQLIDFGQSIDLTKFPRGTTFLAKVATSGFQCIEMRTDRPWTFQTDLFGLVGTVHVVLFGSYMNVFEERGVWRVTGNFMRKWNVPLWKQLFKELLNVPSCHEQPDLARLRAEFESHFVNNLIPAYNLWVQDIKNLDIACE